MEQIILEDKVLWPKEERVSIYQTEDELIAAIKDGSAPRNLRLGNSEDERQFWDQELDFWVGKKIGHGKPRYKRHLSEVKRSEKPFSSWLMPASLKRDEREELDTEGLEVAVVGGTSEGTSLVQEILGNKDFDYPKPLSLIQAFIRQTTSDDDVILDFFAGSGTTAQAVLAQNQEDDGDRRFILVSSTEANKDEPEKNVCRDVCARRVRGLIDGYSVPTRKGIKEIEALDGDFAYLKCQRILPGRMLEIEHEQVWTALLLIQRDILEPYADGDFLIAVDEDSALVYIPRFTKELVPAVRKAVKDFTEAMIYSWQPEALRQHIRAGNVQHEAIPEVLARRFGMKG